MFREARAWGTIRDPRAVGTYRVVVRGGRFTTTSAVRLCSRTGCSERATVTLTYHYGRSTAWLDHLSAERDPHAYDLCDRHGQRLSVPSGWSLDDRRDHRHELIAV